MPTRVLGLPQSKELTRVQASKSGKALLGPLLQQVGTENKQVPLLSEGKHACSLYGVRVSACPGIGLERWLRWIPHLSGGFPGGSEDKEPACNEGDSGLIPGLGKSPGEGNDYPL